MHLQIFLENNGHFVSALMCKTYLLMYTSWGNRWSHFTDVFLRSEFTFHGNSDSPFSMLWWIDGYSILHNSWAAVACAKNCCYLMSLNWSWNHKDWWRGPICQAKMNLWIHLICWLWDFKLKSWILRGYRDFLHFLVLAKTPLWDGI